GPIVLPDPLAKPLTRSVAVGAASGTGPFADNGVIAAISAAVAKRVSVLFVIICRLLCVSTYLCRGRQHTACRAKNTSEAVLLSILGAAGHPPAPPHDLMSVPPTDRGRL